MLRLGLGLGAILSRASSVTDSMVEAASLGLADSLVPGELAADLIYPRIERIRTISVRIACNVIRAAQKEVHSCIYMFYRVAADCASLKGVDRSIDLRTMSEDDLMAWIKKKMWSP